jgi:transcriptional regulator with XRE-family HTH domain
MLRQLREGRGRSLRAAAAALEVAPSHLSRLERGERSASHELTHRMAAYYGVSQEIVGLADGRVPEDVIAILQARPELLDEIRALTLETPSPGPNDGPP